MRILGSRQVGHGSRAYAGRGGDGSWYEEVVEIHGIGILLCREVDRFAKLRDAAGSGSWCFCSLALPRSVHGVILARETWVGCLSRARKIRCRQEDVRFHLFSAP